ncbi:hypothetical protein GLOTRDRAFT_31683, partial [Gloeophyllum trabeum ATCC 11539]
SLHLSLLPQTFYVIQLKPGEAIPDKFLSQLGSSNSTALFSITKNVDETTVVGEYDSKADIPETYADWRCIKIAGPMDFGLVGVICSFTMPLKAAGVPVFAISTWNTDYILIPRDKIEIAKRALEDDGWTFTQ